MVTKQTMGDSSNDRGKDIDHHHHHHPKLQDSITTAAAPVLTTITETETTIMKTGNAANKEETQIQGIVPAMIVAHIDDEGTGSFINSSSRAVGSEQHQLCNNKRISTTRSNNHKEDGDDDLLCYDCLVQSNLQYFDAVLDGDETGPVSSLCHACRNRSQTSTTTIRSKAASRKTSSDTGAEAKSSSTATPPPPPPPPKPSAPPPQIDINEEEYEQWLAKIKTSSYWNVSQVVKDAPEYIRNNKNFVIAALGGTTSLEYASPQLRNDKQFVLVVVKEDPYQLEFASAKLRNDKHVVMAAVQKDGKALEFASPTIQNNKDVVLVAVQDDCWAFRFASPELQQNDKQVALAAMKHDSFDTYLLSQELWNDEDIVNARRRRRLTYAGDTEKRHQQPQTMPQTTTPTTAPSTNTLSTDSTSSSLPNNNKDELQDWLSKIEKSGDALKGAPKNIRNNKEIVMAAVKKFGYRAFRYATPQLRSDKEVVMVAVTHSWQALEFASPSLQNDKQVVLVAVQKNGAALRWASKPLQKDKDVVLAAVKQNSDCIKFAHDDIKRDQDILIAARMFDESHNTVPNRTDSTRKIVFSTRFSMTPSSHSQATRYTTLLKQHEYIQNGNFKIYAPNAFDKKTCDPEWTRFDWPCRGTSETCRYNNVLKDGHPTDDCCWRFSFRNQLQEAKNTQGFMLQLIEADKWGKGVPQKLGNGQRIELDMANSMNLKVFQVYRPTNDTMIDAERYELPFNKTHMDSVTWEIFLWYSSECQDMSVIVIRL